MPKVTATRDGYPQVIPYLCIDGAREAIAFYCEVFGADERMCMYAPDGKVGHAELELGDSLIMLSDMFPSTGAKIPKTMSPTSLSGTPVFVSVYVDDVDEVFDRAVSLGATALLPVQNQYYGDRTGQFEDPWGHQWNIATHVEDVAPDELEKRATKAMGGGG